LSTYLERPGTNPAYLPIYDLASTSPQNIAPRLFRLSSAVDVASHDSGTAIVNTSFIIAHNPLVSRQQCRGLTIIL
jgi:hypothetical protein